MSKKDFQIRLEENIQIREQRPPRRLLKKHAVSIRSFDEIKKAQADLERQSKAILAMAAEKGRLAGVLERELMEYAKDYEGRTMKLGDIVVTLEEIAPRKSPTPTWTKFREWAFGKFGAISAEMRAEAEAFLESTKREIPGREVLKFKRESITLVETWPFFTKLVYKFKAWGQKIGKQIKDFSSEFYNRLEGLA